MQEAVEGGGGEVVVGSSRRECLKTHSWQIKWRRQQQHQARNEQEGEEGEEEEEAQEESGLQPTATRTIYS